MFQTVSCYPRALLLSRICEYLVYNNISVQYFSFNITFTVSAASILLVIKYATGRLSFGIFSLQTELTKLAYIPLTFF